MINVALCITHADFDPVRQRSMGRLRTQLQLGDIVGDRATVPIFGRIPYREETGRAKHYEWSKRQWEWGAALKNNGIDWVIYLQDDVIVAPDFWQRLEVVLRDATKKSWLSLLTNHIGSRTAFLEGHVGYWTLDGLTGTGYAVCPWELTQFLDWREHDIVPGSTARISEDVLIDLYCLASKRSVYTPLPGLIDHDLFVGTTHSQEHFVSRRAYVRWDDEDRRDVVQPKGGAFFGRFYETAHTMLPGVLLDARRGVELAREYELMHCPAQYARYFELLVAQKDWA